MKVPVARMLGVVLSILLYLSCLLAAESQAAVPTAGGSTGSSSAHGSPSPSLVSVSNAPDIDNDAAAVQVNRTNFVAIAATPKSETGIDWRGLAASSITLLSLQTAFRCATEEDTRDAFSKPFWPGYINAAGSLHGWADGDEFMVNYIGHPMQGAVTGFMWQHNDRSYRAAVFGKNTRYWKARLRGMAFAYVYGVQFEIGLVSEASVGQIQASYPAYGFVDHIVTPAIGTGWAVAEDSIDKYLIRKIEAHAKSPWVRVASRIALNPSRSMSNLMNYELPQHRDDRPGVFQRYPEAAAMKALVERETAKMPVHSPPGVAPFEFTFAPNAMAYFGTDAKGSCIGGGGSAAFRLASQWQLVASVNGCKLQDLPNHVGGDSLTYMIGPRWTPTTTGRWSPYAHLLGGGNKLTQERLLPAERAAVAAEIAPEQLGNEHHKLYTKDWETNGVAIAIGSGLDYKLKNALAWRIVALDYQRSWNNRINGINYGRGLKFTTGLVLRMGTW